MGCGRRGGWRLTTDRTDGPTAPAPDAPETATSAAVATARRPDASMSLLLDVMTHTVDQGYADAAKRKAERRAAGIERDPADRESDAAPSRGPTGPVHWPGKATVFAALVLVGAGALFATSAVETRRGDAAAKRDQARLVAQVHQQTGATDALQQQADQLDNQITSARDRQGSADAKSAQLHAAVDQLNTLDGAVAITGSGVRVVLNNAPAAAEAADDGSGIILDSDLQHVVNGLFLAGAEGVAINGERLTTQTAIREAGGAILVDYRPLSPPYSIEAIGPPDLGSSFQSGAVGRLYVTEHQLYGLVFTVADHQRLTLPAAASLVVHYAKPLESP